MITSSSGAYVQPDVPKMSDDILLAYLREHKPHLFDIEMMVNQIINQTGYGEVVFTLRVSNGLVEKSTASFTKDRIYVHRRNNEL